MIIIIIMMHIPFPYLKNASYCYCKDELNQNKTEESLCNVNCAGTLKSCGGAQTALVYSGKQ